MAERQYLTLSKRIIDRLGAVRIRRKVARRRASGKAAAPGTVRA